MGAIESLFGKALKVESPWGIEKVEFVEGNDDRCFWREG
jgi:hypothetical protein